MKDNDIIHSANKNDSFCIGFIGLGLIGGSIAKSLKRYYRDNVTIIAYDTDIPTLECAAKEKIIDISCNEINASFQTCNLIFLCAPVSFNNENLALIKQYISKDCILTDVGSVKTNIHLKIQELGLTSRFIGGHPMAGSEKSGYENSTDRMIENAYFILTPTKETKASSISFYKELVTNMGSIPLILDYEQHDYATAAISHVPHIIAASLVNLVKNADNEQGVMKTIAAGGFKDITRIASSSSTMWQQVSMENKKYILILLQQYMNSLNDIYKEIDQSDANALYSFFSSARNYRDSLIDISDGPIERIYSIYVDIPDETGVIATIATILASHQINLRNIGIIHNREFEEGVLRIDFNHEEAMHQAITTLNKHNYTIFKR